MRGDFPAELNRTEVWNAVAAAMGQGLALGGRARAMLRLAPDEAVGEGAGFEITTPEGPVLAQIRSLPLGQMTRTELQLDALSSLPAALGDAILAMAADTLVGVLGEGSALVQGMTRISPDVLAKSATAQGVEKIVARIDGGWGAEAEVLLMAESAVLTGLALRLPRGPAGHLPDAIAGQIPLRCSLQMVGRTLPLHRLRGLRLGDVILSEREGLRLVAPHARFELAQDETNWTIAEVAMNDDMPEAVADAGAVAVQPAESAEPPAPIPVMPDINEVPIRLSFLLADRMMTLGEVQGLAKGAVVPFAVDAPKAGQPVRILANGKPMGEGHIVEVEGQAAVRIASLFGQG